MNNNSSEFINVSYEEAVREQRENLAEALRNHICKKVVNNIVKEVEATQIKVKNIGPGKAREDFDLEDANEKYIKVNLGVSE